MRVLRGTGYALRRVEFRLPSLVAIAELRCVGRHAANPHASPHTHPTPVTPLTPTDSVRLLRVQTGNTAHARQCDIQ
jgi:hypothetical protein